ncbi:hypothetical protein SELMODRAFT_413980 [Selaginella moellendorffii]|uniref:Uncharacterized protein n=1 Tax=Selaginella moellendorffii TaxID=88036 RepID=D8RR88_SELML|nr:hypothetical protein SELMODRAFT_413980 [Selaginella moellendorffii]
MEMTIKFQLALAVLLVAVWIQSVQCKIIGKAEVDFSGYCSDASIPPGSTYWQSLNLTLSDIVANTPNATNLTYTVKHGRDDVTSYGQGVCFNQPPHENSSRDLWDLLRLPSKPKHSKRGLSVKDDTKNSERRQSPLCLCPNRSTSYAQVEIYLHDFHDQCGHKLQEASRLMQLSKQSLNFQLLQAHCTRAAIHVVGDSKRVCKHTYAERHVMNLDQLVDCSFGACSKPTVKEFHMQRVSVYQRAMKASKLLR